MGAPLLDITDLTLDFESTAGTVRVLDGVSLSVQRGETFCLVGESGCGKSVTALSIAKLLPSPPARYRSGRILLDGRDVLQATDKELRALRGGIVSYVFQEPGASLNPVLRAGQQVMEALKTHRPEKASESEVQRLFQQVGIAEPKRCAAEFPFRLSGGMQQRVMIAMALACEPRLLVADEPTTALDVTIQAQILDLLRRVKAELGTAILLITHNLGVVAGIADRVGVMYAGEIIEVAGGRDLIEKPLHPYTRALLESVPRLGDPAAKLKRIPGSVPRPGQMPPGCRFFPRCVFAMPECALNRPVLRAVADGRLVRCPYAETLPSFPAKSGPNGREVS